jgi:hypothetical protein
VRKDRDRHVKNLISDTAYGGRELPVQKYKEVVEKTEKEELEKIEKAERKEFQEKAKAVKEKSDI